MRILSIYPGNMQSGWVIVEPGDDGPPKYQQGGIEENLNILVSLCYERGNVDAMLIECPKPMGMPACAEVFETLIWVGRMIEVWKMVHMESTYSLVFRNEVKMHLCGSMRAKDASVNAAVADRYPDTGGGKKPVKGIKAKPGPLFGIAEHQWPALAVAITWLETGRPICHKIKGKQKTKKEKTGEQK